MDISIYVPTYIQYIWHNNDLQSSFCPSEITKINLGNQYVKKDFVKGIFTVKL